VLLASGCAQRSALLDPRSGTEITRSVKLRPGRYFIPASDDGALRIRRDHVTVDCTGVELIGAGVDVEPDAFRGVAVRIEGAGDVTIKNLSARGYKFGLRATNAQRLHVTGCDFSNNYRQHLKSTPQREDESDWLSFHHNDNDEWLRYGAGIYLRNCAQAQVDHCMVSDGQNGLMIAGCNDGTFWANDFSYNSGVGMGLYRSSGNRVMHNETDWCIRGYSHGVYNRGQDSAGILVYEQSCNNTIAYNSATHSGDGLFLWAGQTTMDTGAGGCNDNLIYGNDFSRASNNGIEVTFSRNTIANNRVVECDFGIWGGYSFDTRIVANHFARNRIGIGIEHGQGNLIAGNTFDGENVAIKIWQNARQDPNWGYPKHRDTRSRDYTIFANLFRDVPQPLDARDTRNVRQPEAAAVEIPKAPEPIQGAPDVVMEDSPARRLGRDHIVVNEWGPVRVISTPPGPRASQGSPPGPTRNRAAAASPTNR
jgi:parallel beta-helix repeat protein